MSENQGNIHGNIISTPPICGAVDTTSSKPALAGSSTLQCYNYGEIRHIGNESVKLASRSEKHLLIEEEYLMRIKSLLVIKEVKSMMMLYYLKIEERL